MHVTIKGDHRTFVTRPVREELPMVPGTRGASVALVLGPRLRGSRGKRNLPAPPWIRDPSPSSICSSEQA